MNNSTLMRIFQCSKSCDTGLQVREIKCMDEYQRWSKACDELKKPTTYRSCAIAKCGTNGQSQGGEIAIPLQK